MIYSDTPAQATNPKRNDTLALKGPKRVLVIDDDAVITSFIATVLRNEGYQLIVTDSVEKALDGFSTMNYALVITDIFMQGMGGIKGISEIREHNPKVKIIAMSGGFEGMNAEEALKAARKIGADAVMAKPLSAKTIATTVGKILS